jgi:hypothetical protein
MRKYTGTPTLRLWYFPDLRILPDLGNLPEGHPGVPGQPGALSAPARIRAREPNTRRRAGLVTRAAGLALNEPLCEKRFS